MRVFIKPVVPVVDLKFVNGSSDEAVGTTAKDEPSEALLPRGEVADREIRAPRERQSPDWLEPSAMEFFIKPVVPVVDL